MDVLSDGFSSVELLSSLPQLNGEKKTVNIRALNPVNRDYLFRSSIPDTVPFSNLDERIVEAARISFRKFNKVDSVRTVEADANLLTYLWLHKHMSPFEQVSFTFAVTAPVMVWWHLLRHRTMSPNLMSGRYVKFSEDAFYQPTVWRKQSLSNKQGSEGVIEDQFMSDVLSGKLIKHYQQSYTLYQEALDAGVAKEQARLFLPAWGSYYAGMFTVNLRNLFNLLSQRLATDTQHETRQYAKGLLALCTHQAPYATQLFLSSQR